ncbi:hypothetical protein AUJ17_02225 [Candidatus Micrarchaeota archaeon CG1_02_47_40]|nr:MAG: hypothetical protein AUJ17_02225 [Candidatus Micrarchaeota archaeon CG1_02_47_40]
MIKIYEIESAKKGEVKKILEADPYGEISFARNGYKLKDGSALEEDAAKCYLYLKSEEGKFFAFAKEKLGALASEVKEEAAQKIIAKIEEEEAGAEVGMGAIFG